MPCAAKIQDMRAGRLAGSPAPGGMECGHRGMQREDQEGVKRVVGIAVHDLDRMEGEGLGVEDKADGIGGDGEKLVGAEEADGEGEREEGGEGDGAEGFVRATPVDHARDGTPSVGRIRCARTRPA